MMDKVLSALEKILSEKYETNFEIIYGESSFTEMNDLSWGILCFPTL